MADAAKELGLAASTLHRWLGDGFIAGGTTHPRRALADPPTDDIHALFVDDAPDGWLAMLEATLAYGVSRRPLCTRCQARRTQSGPRPHRTPKRPEYPAPTTQGMFRP